MYIYPNTKGKGKKEKKGSSLDPENVFPGITKKRNSTSAVLDDERITSVQQTCVGGVWSSMVMKAKVGFIATGSLV